MDSDAITQPTQGTPTTTADTNGSSLTESKITIDDEDAQAVFLNNCIEKESIDFEKSAQDKRNAKIDGKRMNSVFSFHSVFVYSDEPMPGNDANSPSITNQLRNEELQRRKAVASNYDMFADDYSDTNVRLIFRLNPCE